MTLTFFAKGCHPCPSVFVLFVQVTLSLVSGFLVEIPARMAILSDTGHLSLLLASYQRGQGSDLCGPLCLRRSVTTEKLLYRTINYNKMGWDCLGTSCTNRTGKCHLFLLTLRMVRQQPRDALVTVRRRNLRGGMAVVVLEMDICAMLNQ